MPVTEATILERLIGAEHTDLPVEVARYFVQLDFPPRERARIEELTAKEAAGNLVSAELSELESYRHLGQVLARVQQRARKVIELSEPSYQVAPGVRRSQEAFWRDLPDLLKKKTKRRKWVAYHGDELVGVAADPMKLRREIHRRGIPGDEYYLAVIRPHDVPPWEPEEVEGMRPRELDDLPPES